MRKGRLCSGESPCRTFQHSVMILFSESNKYYEGVPHIPLMGVGVLSFKFKGVFSWVANLFGSQEY